MTRQFVSCKFNPWDRRTYTYHNDGAPVAKGDQVLVETRAGKATVTVESVWDPGRVPGFETKPILGLAPPSPAEPAPAPRLL